MLLIRLFLTEGNDLSTAIFLDLGDECEGYFAITMDPLVSLPFSLEERFSFRILDVASCSNRLCMALSAVMTRRKTNIAWHSVA